METFDPSATGSGDPRRAPFNDAKMVTLLAPRPFMVERGHWDGVAPDEWVAYEYAKVRRMYDTLGLGDRTDIESFDGLHEINGKGTFEFLQAPEVAEMNSTEASTT